MTRDINGFSVLFEGSKWKCKKYALGRWGHYPPFCAITTRTEKFEKAFR